MSFDCTKCGACCSAYPVHFFKPHNIDEKHYIKINSYINELKRDLDNRCCALEGEVGKSVKCSIYKDRPSACDRFQAGGERCINLRKLRSINN
jgi:Fe-S-cluster containining protein